MFTTPRATILNVDDNRVSRRITTRVLQKHGFVVVEASDGEEALRLAGDNPDLVLLDVNLPGLSGYEVCRRLRSDPLTAAMPVLHLSASRITAQDLVEGLEGGADGYLVHPVDTEVLVGTIKSLIRARRAELEVRRASQEWQSTFDAIADGVCVLDPQGRVRRCNRGMMALCGWPPESLVGRAGCEFPGGGSEEAVRALFARFLERREREILEVSARGRWYHITLDPALDPSGALAGAVETVRDVTELVTLREELRVLARVDELTDLFNRRGFYTLADHHLKLAQRNGVEISFLLADLDGLKGINDTFGHHEGDRALVATAIILKQTFRESDVVARLGGDEFAVMMVGIPAGGVEGAGARLRAAVEQANRRGQRPYALSLSFGVASFLPGGVAHIEDLLVQADRVMYEEKRKKWERRARLEAGEDTGLDGR